MDLVLGNYKAWKKRNDMICDIPSMLAYSLHPIYKGKNLTEVQMNLVKAKIYKNGEQTYAEFEKFLRGENEFGDEFLLKTKPEVY